MIYMKEKYVYENLVKKKVCISFLCMKTLKWVTFYRFYCLIIS